MDTPTPPKFKYVYLIATNGLGDVRGKVGSATLSGEIRAWYRVGSNGSAAGERTKVFSTIADAERFFLQAKHLTVKRYFTPSLTARDSDGVIKGWAHWDAAPFTARIDGRLKLEGIRHDLETLSLSAAADFLAQGGCTVKEEPPSTAVKHGAVTIPRTEAI